MKLILALVMVMLLGGCKGNMTLEQEYYYELGKFYQGMLALEDFSKLNTDEMTDEDRMDMMEYLEKKRRWQELSPRTIGKINKKYNMSIPVSDKGALKLIQESIAEEKSL